MRLPPQCALWGVADLFQVTFTGVDIFDRQNSRGEEDDSDESSAERDVGVQEFIKKRWNLNASFQLPPIGGQLMRETFHLINSRFLSDGIDAIRWPGLMREYLELLKPGGWVQMVEVDWSFQSDSGVDLPNLEEWWNTYSRALHRMGKDPVVARSLRQRLSGAGFVRVDGSFRQVPVGGWQTRICMGDTRLGDVKS